MAIPSGETEMSASRKAAGVAASLSVVFIWATWLVSTRYATATPLKPLDLSLLRYGIPALVLAPVWLKTGLLPKGVSKWTILLIVLGSGAPFFQIVAYGVKFTPASAAGVLLPGLMPFSVAMIGILFMGERPDLSRRLGMAAILLGGLMLLAESMLENNGIGWQGFVVLPFCGILWAIYTHSFRNSGLNAIEGAALICIWSTIFNVALIPFLGLHYMEATIGQIVPQMIAQGILSGLGTTLLYGTGVAILGGTQAAAYTAITPVAAAFGGALVLGEQPGLMTYAAAFVTGAGVLLSTGIFSRRV
ncbi:DMT family transporter [Rhizobium sp. L1K21]|uniref:DMT family transporter n=1 Tax=Rhizobium sp. L1K21 TaxID=2954933 RepID=UPI0020937C3B|nr:DMT family transporter [Rhizobium sp. L1K21]MCO6186650.1 DMT family transporter [Rhizobium sp. L1K21]